MDIRTCSVAEIEAAGALHDLLASYGAESSMPELGAVSAHFDTYRAMEAAGALHVIGAFDDGLVGVATLLVYGLPHYGGRRICSLESFFVSPAFRRGGTGLKLLRAAETKAMELGAAALLVSAPVGGRLANVLPRTGYRETNRVFVRGLV